MAIGTDCLLMMGSRLVGSFSIDSQTGKRFFRYSEQWRQSGFPISPTLPFDRPIEEAVFLTFLENMLPEGRALEHLSQLNSISKNNVLALCLAIKNDLSGALSLIIGNDEQLSVSDFRPIEQAEIVQRLNFPQTSPMDIWDGKPRLSVAGMQTKLNVLKLNKQWGLASGKTLSSTHILKFESKEQKFLLLNEFLTMRLAELMGYSVAKTELTRVGNHRVLEVTRFDRSLNESSQGNYVARRHMIDACQALGLTSSFKYEQNFGNGRDVAHIRDGVSFQKLFSLTHYAENPVTMTQNFLHWMLFNLIVGNCDAHGKNFSFFVTKNGLIPTPWYDLISVVQIPEVSHLMAMSYGDEFELEHIHALQLLYEAKKSKLMFKLVENSLESFLKRLSVSLQALKMPQDSDDQEKAFFLRYKNNLQIRSERWIKELKLLPELAKDSTLF